MSTRRRLIIVAILWALAGGLGSWAAAADPRADIHLLEPADGRGYKIELTGLPAETLEAIREASFDLREWQALMPVRVGDASWKTPPMLGQYRVGPASIVFTPRFPLRPGLTYRAIFEPKALPRGVASARRFYIELEMRAKPRLADAGEVVAVYPSGDELPANLLKFYIHFSTPMGRGASYRHIALVDEAGQPVKAPFLEIGEELWDRSGRRLTVLFDPGRLKRGLRPREELGPPLVEGRNYELVIAAAWSDAEGEPLQAEFRKKFRVTTSDETQPDPQRWKTTSPTAGTRELLVVAFDEPLDRAMLAWAIKVVDANGTAMEGKIAIDEHETRWSFQPAAEWTAGRHELRIHPTLEDRAGNSVGRPFEVDGVAAEGAAGEESPRRIPFEIAPIE